MTTLKSMMVGLLASLMVTVPTASAMAQDAVILFIDQAKLLRDSRAGQSIAEQVKELAAEAQKEVQAAGAQLEQAGQQLQQSRGSMSDEDFGKRYQALMQDAQRVGQLQQIKQAEIQAAEQRAIAKLNEELQPVVEKILKRRKATVLLERRAVIFADEEKDITDDIVKALNRAVRRIDVEKVDLVAEAEAARAAQAN